MSYDRYCRALAPARYNAIFPPAGHSCSPCAAFVDFLCRYPDAADEIQLLLSSPCSLCDLFVCARADRRLFAYVLRTTTRHRAFRDVVFDALSAKVYRQMPLFRAGAVMETMRMTVQSYSKPRSF